MDEALISAPAVPVRSDTETAAADTRRPILPKAGTIYRESAFLIPMAVEYVLRGTKMPGAPDVSLGMPGLPDYIKKSKLRTVARRELRKDIDIQLSRGFCAPSRFASMRMRRAIKRYLEKEARQRRDVIGLIPFQKSDEETGARRVIDLDSAADLPALTLEAYRRIDAAYIYNRHLLESRVSGYSGSMKGLQPPETLLKQSFDAFALSLGEAQASEYFGEHGRNGVSRWSDTICHQVVSKVLETTVPFGDDYISYPGLASGGREDLEAIVEAAIHRVINGTGGWRESMSRCEKLKWFKVINYIGKQDFIVYQAADVDRWSFRSWRDGKLPDSSKASRKIEALLRLGRINRSVS